MTIIPYDEFRRVRGLVIDGVLWLIAKDVATLIGVLNVTECLKCSPQNIKEAYSFRGVKKTMYLLNADGVQEFITLSNHQNKAEARARFKTIFKGDK